jgi:proline iminopeptidase
MTVETDDRTRLHVGVTGSGPDVLVLSGGPGCVHYLESEAIAPRGTRAWYPEPRGVGRSGGGPHGLSRAVADLEAVRRAAGVNSWVVLGHSWGADLAVRYALDHPSRVRSVVAVAGHGLHKDRTWSQAYESLKDTEPRIDIPWEPAVHRALTDSFLEWIHEPELFRNLADCAVPMTVIAAERDIRPSWPLRQLAALVPFGSFVEVPGVPHDFWSTDPQTWVDVVSKACDGTA